ncbi:MAG: leucyl/phenylalanyl-tRNA--protein transferase [Roseovarius sp.]|nr:leucyl/phenylalanyl-tRNA--protein transferase [Roseovarius sp.]
MITTDQLLMSYSLGKFPMAKSRNSKKIYWIEPRHRGIIPLKGFHISRSLSRRMRKGGYRIFLNSSFDAVVEGCADRDDTWINDEIKHLYQKLHFEGHAHSFEIWHDGTLSGGVYGVTLGAAFFGESMFSRKTDASKLTLAHLVDHLSRCEFALFDTQFLTDHLASLGAIKISQKTYRKYLERAIFQTADIYSSSVETDPRSVLQRITQMS